jgi:hypothetical protein
MPGTTSFLLSGKDIQLEDKQPCVLLYPVTVFRNVITTCMFCKVICYLRQVFKYCSNKNFVLSCWGFYGTNCSERGILGCDTMFSCDLVPSVWRTCLFHLHGWKWFWPQNGNSMFVQNTGVAAQKTCKQDVTAVSSVWMHLSLKISDSLHLLFRWVIACCFHCMNKMQW